MHAKRLMPTPNFAVLHELSCCYVGLKAYDLAEETCREAIRIYKSKQVYKLLAVSLIYQNKIGEAIEIFRLALRYKHLNCTVLPHKYLILKILLKHFHKFRMFPKSSSLYTSFGKLCARMNFEEDAQRTLLTAIKLDNSNLVALSELAVLHQVCFNQMLYKNQLLISTL